MRVIAVFFAAAGLLSGTAHGQMLCPAQTQVLGAPFPELEQTMKLAKGTPASANGVFRLGWSLVQDCSDLGSTADSTARFAWSILPAGAAMQYNSKYPRTQEDGLRWSGRGVSGSASAGAALRYGPITAALVPVGAYHQNEDFPVLAVPTPELSQYNNYFHRGAIDWPQRFGSSTFWWAHLGQSFVRADAYGLMAGFSTENMRWGPARKNPIMMSGAGAGFPHFFAGTSKPIDARFVELGIEAIWGRLAESEYFDTLSTNDDRLFAGIVATISPKGSGLTLGLTRAYLRTIPGSGLSLSEQIFGPYTGIRENPLDSIQGDNQLLSVFLTWSLPDAGFEAYGEYAREDHWEDGMDLVLQLDHSRGYTVGFEKVFRLRDGQNLLSVAGEATNLGSAPTWQSGRPGGSFYVHGQVRQGYTHRGQLLGAPIGPGSDAQYIAVDYMTPELMGGVYLERIRYDNEAYYSNFAFPFGPRGHDGEYTFGLRGGYQLRNFQIAGDIGYSARYNRGFVNLIEVGRLTFERNFFISLGATWMPFKRTTETAQ